MVESPNGGSRVREFRQGPKVNAPARAPMRHASHKQAVRPFDCSIIGRPLLFSRPPPSGRCSLKTESWRLKRITTHIRDEIRGGSNRLGARKKFLAKRIRAHDGCLGIGRRRRTRKTATSHGEPSTGLDPWVSEWGNPAGVISRRLRVNKDSPQELHVGK